MTTGRRVSPTFQLKCVGGSAKGAFTPKVVQCANQGFDGSDVQWRCDADLPHDMEFGSVSFLNISISLQKMFLVSDQCFM